MTVNVLGPITVSYYVLNSMREHNKGVIINVASRAGVVTGAMSSAYSASKAALIRATGNIQQECIQEGKDGISLFSLHPGGVKTAMNESTHPSLPFLSSLPLAFSILVQCCSRGFRLR
jgi:short-subunit dehydrogenase